MPDKNYNVDDILREFRSKQPPEPPASGGVPRASSYREEEEDYRAPAKPARRQPPSRPAWEEDEEPPRPARQPRSAGAARQQPSSRPLWEDEEDDAPPLPRSVEQPPSRPLWEDGEDDAPPLPRSVEQPRAAKPPRRQPPSRSLWEDGEDDAPPLPRSVEQSRAAKPPRQQPPSRSLWEDGEDDAPPLPRSVEQPRAAKPARPEPPARSRWEEDEPKTPRQAARSQALWEAEEEKPPRQSSPALSRSAKSSREIPSLSRWEEEYEPPAPVKPVQPPRQEAPARPLWKDETAAPADTGRKLDASAAARLITGGDEEDRPRRRKRTGEDEEERPRRRRGEEEDEEERPRPRRRRSEEEDEEERPRPRRRRSEEEDEEERPRPRRRRGEEEDEEERPRPRRKRGEEEAETERPRPQHIGAQLRGMKTGLIIRLVVNLLCAAGVIYLMLAPGLELPIPEYFMDHPDHYLWLGVALVAVSALASGNTVGGGIISLFCLRPNNDSYSSIGVFACLVQGAYMAMRPEMMGSYARNLYLPMAALLLLFNTVGKLILRARVAGSYRFIAQEGAKHTAAVIEDHQLAGKIGGDIIDDDPEIAYFTRSAGVLAFMDQAFSESKTEDISKVIAPMTAVAALVMALISYPFHKDVFTSACVFTAALCITAPVAGVIAANLPIALTNRRIGRWGATLCGYSAVDQFATVNELLLRGYDLFPPESVTLHTIRPLNRAPLDSVLVDTASVLSQCGSTLTQIFTGMLDNPALLRETESFICEDGKGVSAWVEGRRVLIGNRALMDAYGVAIPPKDYEDQYGQGKQVLYISNSGQAAAMCVLGYKADKQMRRALELLADRDIAVCVYTTDPNVTADRISQTYAFPRELVKVIPAALHREVDPYLDPKAKARAGMVHSGTPSSYVRGVAAARSCDNALTVETALLLLSVVVGFALVTFFAFTGGMPALTWVTIAVYQTFWALVELLVALFKSN